jgi:hypothetical protein
MWDVWENEELYSGSDESAWSAAACRFKTRHSRPHPALDIPDLATTLALIPRRLAAVYRLYSVRIIELETQSCS